MNVQYFTYLRKDRPDRELANIKLRQSLIALKQFEQCYIVARWIRILWTDILDRSSRKIKGHEHSPSDSNLNASINDQAQFSTQSATNMLYIQSQITETEHVRDERSEMSPYHIGDWSSLFSLDDYDAHSDVPMPNTLEYHGLQFLANLGSVGYNSTG